VAAGNYVILLSASGAARDVRRAVDKYFQSKRWEVWNGFEGAWLVADAPPELTPARLRDELWSVVGVRGKVLVIELGEEVSYAGRLAEERIPWLQHNWRLVDDPGAWAKGRGG
jgi:hypothetical protein